MKINGIIIIAVLLIIAGILMVVEAFVSTEYITSINVITYNRTYIVTPGEVIQFPVWDPIYGVYIDVLIYRGISDNETMFSMPVFLWLHSEIYIKNHTNIDGADIQILEINGAVAKIRIKNSFVGIGLANILPILVLEITGIFMLFKGIDLWKKSVK